MPEIGTTWWQFSDIHWPRSPSGERLEFTDHLVRHLTDRIVTVHGAPDFIVITGDIAATGHSDEYSSVTQNFIAPLLKAFTQEAQPPIYTVPGNHDQDRTVAQDLNPNRINGLNGPSAIDTFLAEGSSTSFASPFASYCDFAVELGSGAPAPPTLSSPAWTVHGATYDIHLVGVNSAWSGYCPSTEGHTSDERRLLLGLKQVPVPDLTHDTDYRILVMHHPLDWFNRDLCSRVEQRILQHFDLVLFGHVHTPRDLQLRVSSSATCCLVPSPLLFGTDYEDSTAYARGFVVGQVFPDSAQCRTYYYRYSDTFGAKFIPYSELYRTDQDYFEVSLRQRNSRLSEHEVSPTRHVVVESTISEPLIRPEITEMFYSRLAGRANLLENSHAVDVFRKLVAAHHHTAPLGLTDSSEALALAYILAELVVLRGDTGRLETPHVSGLLQDLETLTAATPILSVGDVDQLNTILSTQGLSREHGNLSQLGSLNDTPASAWFLLLRLLAWTALLMDEPKHIALLLPPDDALDVPPTDHKNVLSITGGDSTHRPVVLVRTSTRREFVQIAEARYLLDSYLAEVEDVWRRSGLLPPPLSTDVAFPLWTHREVETYQLRVDPKPIARLLMGRALYGERQHVWIRELVQNAIDAVEMRRIRDRASSYDGKVTVRLDSMKSVVVADDGIGMSQQYVISYLATLGRSGWRSYLDENVDSSDASFFGRFGIGFASVFGASSDVHVHTRPAHSRGVDGIHVRFTDPERPFFVEPDVCDEGTRIEVRLAENMSALVFRDIMRELFVYIPDRVTVLPDPELPRSLGDAHPAMERLGEARNNRSVGRVSEHNVGPYKATFRVDLVAVTPVTRRRKSAPRPAVSTSLTVGVAGIRVFDQEALKLTATGAKPRSYVSPRDQNLGLRWCYVTIDFDRDNAPVLPSRNSLDIDDALISSVSSSILEEVCILVEELVDQVADTHAAPRQRRGQILDALESCVHPPEIAGNRPIFHSSTSLRRVAARLYRQHCPVLIRSHGGVDEFHSLTDLEGLGEWTVVLEGLTESSSFGVYSRARGLERWIVAADATELALLLEAWPSDDTPTLVHRRDQMFLEFERMLPEVREGELISLLRGDYALVRSDIFGESLFFHVPSGIANVSRHQGIGRKRSEMSMRMHPRVVLNAEHKVIGTIARFLESSSDEDAAQVGAWLGSFCDGVVEDGTKLAPEARWIELRAELGRIVGDSIQGVGFSSLRLND